MGDAAHDLRTRVEDDLWPVVDDLVSSRDDLVGAAVAVVGDGQAVMRGFGVRDARTGAPVTPETMFHLASVSKTFVATAVVSLATEPPDGVPRLDLDAPLTRWVPELRLADGRQDEVTPRGLLSHTSGLPDVSDFGWHAPQLDDDALSRFASSLSGWRLASDPGAGFSYSNSGYELLGLLLSRVTGTTFEEAVARLVLVPNGLRRSTFLRAGVPAELAASPHVGMPPTVPGDAYPYTRRHAPSSTLHSNLVELCRWVRAQVGQPPDGLDPALLELVRRAVVTVDEPPSWEEAWGLGWALGTFDGHRVVGHSGADPGFGSKLVVLPGRRTGVVVLANSNTVPTTAITAAALELALGGPGERLAALRALPAPGVVQVARDLAASGPEAAAATFHRLSAPADDADVALGDDEFEKAVWGAIELHRTDLVRPLLRLWTTLRPDSSTAWTMAGWADQLDGDPDSARRLLQRALALDPQNADAALVLRNLPPA